MKPIEKLHLKSIKNCRNWWFSILRFSLRLAGGLPSIGVRRKKALLIERNSCLGIVNSKLIKNLKITALDCRVNQIGEYSCSEKPYGRNHRQVVSHWNCPNWCKLVIFRPDGVRQLDLYLICIWFVFASNKVLSVGEWRFSLCVGCEWNSGLRSMPSTTVPSWLYILAESTSKLHLNPSCIWIQAAPTPKLCLHAASERRLSLKSGWRSVTVSAGLFDPHGCSRVWSQEFGVKMLNMLGIWVKMPNMLEILSQL